LINVDDFNAAKVPLIFDTVYNFRIKVTGNFATASREIEVITYDIDNLAPRMADFLDKQYEEKNSNKNGNASQQQSVNQQQTPDQSQGSSKKSSKTVAPKGQPRIVYWHES